MKKIISLSLLVLLVVSLLVSCGSNVPRPEIKEGRFDYSVAYEMNGETKTVSGVYVCEFAGVDWSRDSGYTRDWNGYIEGGSADDRVELGTTEDGGKIILELGLNAPYFMADPGFVGLETPAPMLIIDYINDETGEVRFIKDADEIATGYGVKIVGYEYAAPVNNTYN